MKNIEEFNVSILNINETKLINGGGIFRDFGKWCGEAWCATKGFLKELASHSDKIVHPGTTFQ
ncbi:MAG: hypothetical protein AB8B65_10355 [Kordia sp.]|uniref:hypothetical protein n=1 Tax=Kordia sp. TaxID=1965332 RepID=UPI00385D099E